MIGYFFVVQFLKHKVTVTGNADFRQVDHRCVSAVCIVVLGKIERLIAYSFPKGGAHNIGGTVIDVIAKVDYNRNFCGKKFVVFRRTNRRCSARFNRNNRGDIFGIGLPAYSSTLRMRDVDSLFPRQLAGVF